MAVEHSCILIYERINGQTGNMEILLGQKISESGENGPEHVTWCLPSGERQPYEPLKVVATRVARDQVGERYATFTEAAFSRLGRVAIALVRDERSHPPITYEHNVVRVRTPRNSLIGAIEQIAWQSLGVNNTEVQWIPRTALPMNELEPLHAAILTSHLARREYTKLHDLHPIDPFV